ncbi:hypothetical protein [Oligoflexus tunisiensis]|uniref:hypothetical protein n=1 Tax=Oligoflexus tunisiensis TaxID=708132 RepID=UPI00114CC27E|nr:hypothetical protein [Oligoflexus tunisiensis]
MRYALVLVLAGLGLSVAPRASAGTFGCESVAGSVIFKDTLYGVLTGSVLSGLYLLSQDKDDRKDTEQALSGGAAIGGLLGFGLGITEIAMRECPGTRLQSEQKGFSTSFAAVPTAEGNLGAGWRMSWRF